MLRSSGSKYQAEDAGQAVADSASLAGSTAADNVNHDVELAIGVGQSQRAADHQLQGFQAEVIVDITIVDGNLAGAIVDTGAPATECFRRPVP